MAGKGYVQAIGGSYRLEDKSAAVQATINCYPQKLDEDNWMLAPTPGEVEIVDLADEVRGSKYLLGRWFVVADDKFYEVTTAGVATERGTLNTSTGFVGMANNETQLAMVDGPDLYIFTLATNIFQVISSPAWLGSDDVQELDGYFVFVDPGTQIFYISAIDDGTNLDALDFSSADSSPDNIITHRVNHRQLWFLGDITSEIWINAGEAAFPFVRYQSYTIDVGVVGKRAAINAADTLFFIGKTPRGTGIVYMAVGNQPQRVSTLPIEEKLLSSTDLSLATMWTYQIQGHEFIGINAPGLDTTLVYDAALKLWHERAEWDADLGWQPLRSRLYTSIDGVHYGGDIDGKLVRLDATLNTLSDRILKRSRTWPHMIQPSLEPISFTGLELSMKTGEGTGDGHITLEISNDGGFLFGPPLIRSLGAPGQRMHRVRWLGLGASRDRVFRVSVSDDISYSLYSAAVDTA